LKTWGGQKNAKREEKRKGRRRTLGKGGEQKRFQDDGTGRSYRGKMERKAPPTDVNRAQPSRNTRGDLKKTLTRRGMQEAAQKKPFQMTKGEDQKFREEGGAQRCLKESVPRGLKTIVVNQREVTPCH